MDTAFLFGLASIGLIIAFLETNKDLARAIEAIPFLFLGVLLPFLIGYMRGAIELDSIEERLRGWIYFLIGTSSYFAFLVFNWVHAEYLYKETAFISVVMFSILVAYFLLKWSKKVFGVSGASCQYAFSGTIFSAMVIAFVNRLSVSIFFDYQNKALSLSSKTPDFLFWTSIVVFAFSIVVILDKASTNAINAELKLPKFEGKLQKILSFTPFKGLILGFMLVEYAFDFNLETFFIWSQAFALWVFGCFLWILGIPLFPQIFFMVAIIFSLIAIIAFFKMEPIHYNNLENTPLNKASYILLVFSVLLSAILFPQTRIQVLIFVILLTILDLLKVYKKKKSNLTDGKQ